MPVSATPFDISVQELRERGIVLPFGIGTVLLSSQVYLSISYRFSSKAYNNIADSSDPAGSFKYKIQGLSAHSPVDAEGCYGYFVRQGGTHDAPLPLKARQMAVQRHVLRSQQAQLPQFEGGGQFALQETVSQ